MLPVGRPLLLVELKTGGSAAEFSTDANEFEQTRAYHHRSARIPSPFREPTIIVPRAYHHRSAMYFHPSTFPGVRFKYLRVLRGLLGAGLPARDSQPGCPLLRDLLSAGLPARDSQPRCLLLRDLLSAGLPARDFQPPCLPSLPSLPPSTRECCQLAVLCCWQS
jgi:hypothetical protein